MRKFNTSGPNIKEEHYTIERTDLIVKGIELVETQRYFTIWAPRQTGKSTYFRQLAEELTKLNYAPVYFSVEGFNDFSASDTFDTFCRELNEQQKIDWHIETFKDFEKQITTSKDNKMVIIIDEIESLNPEIFGQFLHTIRNLYHTRHTHCLKSVILVGVSNIVGVVNDNASPFNIADNLNVPYFTDDEVFTLLGQHETETGQLFEKRVKNKICSITANQPGLVNGFAKRLVEENPDKEKISFDDYLKTEDWYLTEAIDKNFSNILNKAKEQRNFVERLLFTEDKIPFEIDRESIKLLHTNGLIKKDEEGYVAFWVPFYKKRLYKAFYPYTNGERNEINLTFLSSDFIDNQNRFNINKLVENYKKYAKRRGFKPFLETDGKGNSGIKESALIYSFETFITAIIQEIDGKIYREANTGLGKSDMIINVDGDEFVIETKVYSSPKKFTTGKEQLAYYCNSLSLTKGTYLVFLSQKARIPETVKEGTETINNIEISTYLIPYDSSKW